MHYFLNFKFKINCYKIKISINPLKFIIDTNIYFVDGIFFFDYLMLTLKMRVYKSEFFHSFIEV